MRCNHLPGRIFTEDPLRTFLLHHRLPNKTLAQSPARIQVSHRSESGILGAGARATHCMASSKHTPSARLTFLGRCREDMTSMRSFMPAIVTASEKGAWSFSMRPPGGRTRLRLLREGTTTPSGIMRMSALVSDLADITLQPDSALAQGISGFQMSHAVSLTLSPDRASLCAYSFDSHRHVASCLDCINATGFPGFMSSQFTRSTQGIEARGVHQASLIFIAHQPCKYFL